MLVSAASLLACDGGSSDPPTADPTSTGEWVQGPELVWLAGQNPVLPTGHPDPGVLRVEGAHGVTYHLTATVDNAGDFPRFTSTDLIVWTEAGHGLFGRDDAPGGSLALDGAHYCSRWAPEIVQLGAASFMLSFTAQRFAAPQSPCPPYDEDSGVYLAWSAGPAGPFAPPDRPWEPSPAGADFETCPYRPVLPHSLDFAADDCQGIPCPLVMRLDSTVFHDPHTGRWWLAYSWYTNSPPKLAWELANHGQHVSLVELDPNDPSVVRCDLAVAQIHAGNPHDAETLARLAASCSGCEQMLSMTRGPLGEEMMRDGVSLGVVEAPSLFRRGEYVYLLLSGSNWDSPYYHVYWVAAKSVEALAYTDPGRLVGRLLIPSDGQAFGHGSAVLGPDGERWYFVHHRLARVPCEKSGCDRDVWVSPIEFEDRGDGLGDVHIRPRWPAEDPSFIVAVPASGPGAPPHALAAEVGGD